MTHNPNVDNPPHFFIFGYDYSIVKALTSSLIPYRIFLHLFFFIAAANLSFSQKQLVFITHGKVVARYVEGGTFKLKLRNHQRKEGMILELNEFSIITTMDTIKFQSIDKLYARDHHAVRANAGVGGLLFVGGLGYIAIDQLNAALGYNKGGWDSGDQLAWVVAGVGAAILFIKPRYTRLRPGTSIRTVDYKSPFYLSFE